MILLAESGSTKCDWVVLDAGGKVVLQTKTKGLNPSVFSVASMQKHLSENAQLLELGNKIKKLYFYGAGCGTPKPAKTIEVILKKMFPTAKVHIHEDILAACLAVTTQPGIVCILGTGSNACYFDGKKAHLPMPSLGYIIMDEASGNYFGKQLIRDYYYAKMPADLASIFQENYALDADIIKENLYHQPNPNTYLANFAKFIFQHKADYPNYFNTLLNAGINKFIDNRILTLEKDKNLPVHFVGSIAKFSEDIIENCLKSKNLVLGKIQRKPIDGLITYHKKNN